MIKKNELSPVMRQYLDMKSENPNAVLLFRLGDFYEAFFGDAAIVSKALDLVLTHRGTDDRGVEIPMCGIPWHAGDNYLGRLVRQGIMVAIAEQMETPEQAKERGHRQIERRIVRVITPGTLTDEGLLSPKKSNFLAAAAKGAIAAADISTGEFLTGASADLPGDIARLDPAEVLFDEADAERPEIMRIRDNFNATPLHFRQYGGMGEGATAAEKMLLFYLKTTQRDSPVKLMPPRKLWDKAGLLIDQSTWRSLEIDQPLNGGGATLLDIIDRTRTAAGGRLLRQMLRNLPCDADEITARQNHVGHLFLNQSVLRDWNGLLPKIPDVGRAVRRLESGRGMPRDMRAVMEFLKLLPELQVAGLKLDNALSLEFQGLELFESLANELWRALPENPPAYFRDGGAVRAGYSPELDAVRDLAGGAKEKIAELSGEYARKTGANLKIKFNNSIGYYIEAAAKNAAPLLAPDSGFIHRQTMSDNLRFTTAELSDLDSRIKDAAGGAGAIEQKIIADLIAMIRERSDGIARVAEILAEVDVWAALANVAEDWRWTRPKIAKEPVFEVSGGRHPVVEKRIRDHAETFVKNDCKLGIRICDNQSRQGCDSEIHAPSSQIHNPLKNIALLTGPNMAGKSTYLRQNALIVILAHLGSFVPADSAVVGLADQLFSRVGASDNLASGQSTFMVEMTETANILNRATDKSFIIFDEIGRGTATFDGMAIARAVLEHTAGIGARCLFATHYHELTEAEVPGVKNLTIKIAEDGGEIVFLHKIIDGAASHSYGIHVAKMAGMPPAVIRSAERILAQLENTGKNAKEPAFEEDPKGQLSLF